MSPHLLPCGGSLCLWITITVVWDILREPWLFPCGLSGLVYLSPHRLPLAALLVCMWTGPHLGSVYPRPYMCSHSPLPVGADHFSSGPALWSFRSCRSHPPACPQVQTRPKPNTSAQDCSTVSGTPGRLPWLTHLSLRRQSIVWNCVLGEQKMSKLQPVQVDLGTSLQRAARLCLLPLCCSSCKWDTGVKIPGNPRPPSARTAQRQQDLILSCYRLVNWLGRKHSILRDSLALWLEDGHRLSDSVFWKTAVQDLCQPLHWHIILSLIYKSFFVYWRY